MLESAEYDEVKAMITAMSKYKDPKEKTFDLHLGEGINEDELQKRFLQVGGALRYFLNKDFTEKRYEFIKKMKNEKYSSVRDRLRDVQNFSLDESTSVRDIYLSDINTLLKKKSFNLENYFSAFNLNGIRSSLWEEKIKEKYISNKTYMESLLVALKEAEKREGNNQKKIFVLSATKDAK